MTTNITSTLSAIVSAAETARKEGKNSAKTVCRFTRKDGILTPSAKVPQDVDMSHEDYVAYCNAVKYLYAAACNLNANTDPKASKALTSTLYTCASDVLRLIDPTIKLNELPVSTREDDATAIQFVEDVRAEAKQVKMYKEGDDLYREENKTLNQFCRKLEGKLYTIAMHTTFAADYERDYNRAKSSLPAQILKAEETAKTLTKTLSDAETKLTAAKEKGNKTVIAKAQKAYDAAKVDADANAARIANLKAKLSKAEEDYKSAKAAAESVPAVKTAA